MHLPNMEGGPTRSRREQEGAPAARQMHLPNIEGSPTLCRWEQERQEGASATRQIHLPNMNGGPTRRKREREQQESAPATRQMHPPKVEGGPTRSRRERERQEGASATSKSSNKLPALRDQAEANAARSCACSSPQKKIKGQRKGSRATHVSKSSKGRLLVTDRSQKKDP